MRLLASLIGYFAVATLLAFGVLVGYLWQNELLTNEKVFRMVAVMHDVDLTKVEQAESEAEADVPKEEPSAADAKLSRELVLRDYEAKEESLRRSSQEFDHLLEQLREERRRFDRLARDMETRLQERGEISSRENVSQVVSQLESLDPEIVKDLFKKQLALSDGPADVIMLMNAMQQNKLRAVLETFTDDEDKNDLHKIHNLMLEGYPQKPLLDKMFEELNSLGKEGK